MKITRQEEYALRCAVALARTGGGVPVTGAEIGKSEGLSPNYANKILLRLQKGGVVKSVRGVKGGYALVKSPSETTIAQVMQAVSGPLFHQAHCESRFAGNAHECRHNTDCGIRPVWVQIEQQVNAVLTRTVLADVVASEAASHKSLAQRLLTLTPLRAPDRRAPITATGVPA